MFKMTCIMCGCVFESGIKTTNTCKSCFHELKREAKEEEVFWEEVLQRRGLVDFSFSLTQDLE